MKYLKKYKLFESIISWEEIKEFIDELHLRDEGLKLIFQIQEDKNKVVFYFVRYDVCFPNDNFKLLSTKEPFFYLLSYMKSFGYRLKEFEYKSGARWVQLFIDEPNRWGVYSKPEEIYDIQMDSGSVDDIYTNSVEIKFVKDEN